MGCKEGNEITKYGCHLEVIQCQGNVFSQDKLQEDLVKGKVNDSRIEHGFRHELPNDSENVCPFTGKIRSAFYMAEHC